jgi:RNA polymerase sigma factor (sigma-70 family)
VVTIEGKAPLRRKGTLPQASSPVSNQDALADVFREGYGSLHAFASLISGSPGVGEELAQEAFARLVMRVRSGASIDRPDAYLRRAVLNLWRNLIRRKILERRFAARGSADSPGRTDVTDDVAANVAIWRELQQLSNRQRSCIVLRYFEDRTEAETASLLECSIGTVKTHTRRALDRLAERVSDL